ncbi:hypothetical protein WJ08_27050 [Burkholderia vietnamiensis]|nr:hypothetical protein WJ08_27050 [Burkholderia vietnamiensis]KVF41728.1 hypothetical protein WJ10_13815 [Burkholderia vietnamiensis]
MPAVHVRDDQQFLARCADTADLVDDRGLLVRIVAMPVLVVLKIREPDMRDTGFASGHRAGGAFGFADRFASDRRQRAALCNDRALETVGLASRVASTNEVRWNILDHTSRQCHGAREREARA